MPQGRYSSKRVDPRAAWSVIGPMKTILAVVLLLVTSLHLPAQSFTVNLDGLQEVPANAAPGFGSGTLTLTGTNLAWNINFSGLLSGVVASHIHASAGYGTNAPVVLSLNPPLGSTAGSIIGSSDVSMAIVTALTNGLAYVNIHTSVFPGGEIRGQIEPVPEPSTLALAGFGLLTLAVLHRRRA